MYGMDDEGRIKMIQKVESSDVDLDGSGEIIVDGDGDSKIYSTTDDEVIHTAGGAESFTTKSVGIGMPSGKDIYPGGSSVGLQYRFEQLYGGGVPAGEVYYTCRDFATNNFTSHIAGFEDSQTSPYSFGGSPGGFSVNVPANTECRSNHARHFLTLQAKSGVGNYLRWTSSTGYSNIIVLCVPSPLWSTSDYHLTEIRMWGVQNPTSTDKYWAMRFNWLGATYPAFPLRIGLWYGTGVTYSINDGTLVQAQVPWYGDGVFGKLQATVVAGPTCYLTPTPDQGPAGVGISATASGWPTSIKECRIRMATNWTYFHIDTFRVV